MIVELDTESGASYLSLSDEPVARTVSVTDLIMVDLNQAGEPIGVEYAFPVTELTPDLIEPVVKRFPGLERTFKSLAA